MVNLDAIPVRQETRRAVREWARRWEHTANRQMSAEDSEAGVTRAAAEPVPQHEWDALERDGRAVWIRLCDDLGDEWTVGWTTSTDAGDQVEWSPGAPPEPLSAPNH
jgi:hypothetical protein